jgi:hypothetical protein
MGRNTVLFECGRFQWKVALALSNASMCPASWGAGCGWFCWQGYTCAVESQRRGVRGCGAQAEGVCFISRHGRVFAFGISSDDAWLRCVVGFRVWKELV